MLLAESRLVRLLHFLGPRKHAKTKVMQLLQTDQDRDQAEALISL